MARFLLKTKKKKQFEIFAKIAQILLPWQQIKNRRKHFVVFVMENSWPRNVAIRSRNKKRSNVCDRQTDIVNDKK